MDTIEGEEDIIEDEAEPAERFALQRCPRCGSLTRVWLAKPTSGCEICGKVFEVVTIET